jgi:hypothetical protein
MVPRAALVPVEGGFDIYLRDPLPRDIDISGPEPPDLLSTRQRFSFAHEVAHTYFFDLSKSVPTPTGSFSDPTELEKTCDLTAAHILIPTTILRKEIKRKIGDAANIDSAFVRSAASDFRTSIHAMLERLTRVAPSDLDRGVVLIRRLEGDAQIQAFYFGVGLMPILPRPKKYIRVTEWLRDFPKTEIAKREDSAWAINRYGRSVSFTKRELRSRNDFLLQIQASAAYPPE